MATNHAPGRFGNPDMDIQSDPRADPRLLKTLNAIGFGSGRFVPYAKDPTDLVEVEKLVASNHAGFMAFYENVPLDLPGDAEEPEVKQWTVEMDGPDGNKIKLHCFRPSASSAVQLPGIVYLHGGGMTIIKTMNPVHIRWCKSLALEGATVIMPDFRNAWDEGGVHRPFPVPLNDCAAAYQYIYEHRNDLGISNLVLQGESGGANLVATVAMKANREGWIHTINGCSLQDPFISGGYDWPIDRKAKELPSLLECDGYVVAAAEGASCAIWYTPTEEGRRNPHAWSYFASEEDLKGLPPHYVSVSELDPLKSEGLALYRNLINAGVDVIGDLSLGCCHITFTAFRQSMPELHKKMARNIVAFARSL